VGLLCLLDKSGAHGEHNLVGWDGYWGGGVLLWQYSEAVLRWEREVNEFGSNWLLRKDIPPFLY